MDIYVIVPLLIAIFGGYTIIAVKHRKWYFKISPYAFSIWYSGCGLLVGYHIAITFLWNKIRSLDLGYFSQMDEIINAYKPNFDWYVIFIISMGYMIFLHHVIWRFKYRKQRK
jgi:hypothetical protein